VSGPRGGSAVGPKDARRLRTFYPSRLDAWTQCPRRYRFRYVDLPPLPRRGAFAHTSLGAATHLALARWWSLAEDERTGERVAREVDAGWTDEGFADAVMSQRWLTRARSMVATYVEAETNRRRVLVGHGLVEPRRVETSVTMRYDDTLALAGRPDRIDERPTAAGTTELVVVDYKTGRDPPTESDARTSRTLALYAAAAEATLRRPALRVELHHLPTGSITVWRHDEESRDRQVRRAAAVAGDCRAVEDELNEGGCADALFPARPGRLCVWCDYQASCAEGREMGPPAEPWAALEPGGSSDPAPRPG
jgi:RecB family exonuclease